jgi:hypothetical protein
MSMDGLVWLITSTDMPSTTRHFVVPMKVIREIPSFQLQLDEQLANPEDPYEPPTIHDDVCREEGIVRKALRFLEHRDIDPLSMIPSATSCLSTLHDLVQLYNFSLELSIKRLETGIVEHINEFEQLSLDVFLQFARRYYEKEGDEARGTSLGALIKKKLARFLQQWIDVKGMVEVSNEGGVLGKQLSEVLLLERAALLASRAALLKERVERQK